MMRQPPAPLRTYSHLPAGRVPTEYEIVTSRLLYYLERGFEIDVPVAPWYQRHQREVHLRCESWDAFKDPRETTYTSYTRLAARHEQHLDGVVNSFLASPSPARGSSGWASIARQVLPPLRYPYHGFQMVAAYVGQMVPSSRLTLVAMFQAGDEMRRIGRIAERMAQTTIDGVDDVAEALSAWQDGSAWQPLRKLVEETFVIRDWDEAWAALALCAKPVMDALILGEFALAARAAGDYHLGELLASFAEDARWHRQCTQALVALLLADPEGATNRDTLRSFIDRWLPATVAAATGVATLFHPDAASAAVALVDRWHGELGLQARVP